jgi:hypothetical protein
LKSKTLIILLVLAIVGLAVAYAISRNGSAGGGSSGDDDDRGGAAGLVAAIGGGLTGIGSAIAGATESRSNGTEES